MNVLVVGGTGFVGQHLCTELVARDHDVTALAREPERGDLPEAVETVAGDVTDYESIEGAFDGRDAVVYLVALSPLFKPSGGDDRHVAVHLGGTENAVRAAEYHGVDRFVQLSALGADSDGTTAYIRAKGEAEAVVRDSELDWTVFRPSIVFGDGGEFVSFTRLLTTPYVTGLPGGGQTPFQPIWVGEFVPMVADALEGDRHAGEAYEIGGPEVLTLADVAREIYRAEGRSLRVIPVPMVLARIGLAIGGYLPGFPMGSDQYRSLRLDNRVSDNDVDAFGVEADDLTTFREYLAGDTEAAAGRDAARPSGVSTRVR